jgi:hypothetical protein
MKKIHYIITAVCLFSILGCNTPSSTIDDSTDTTTTTVPSTPTINQSIGTWVTGCQMNDETQSFEVFDSTLDAVRLTTHVFSDTECEIPLYDLIEIGNASIASTNPESSLSPIALNLTITSITITLYDQATLVSFNQESECQMNNWQLNTATSVSGIYCSGLNNGVSFLATGNTDYSLYAISGNLLYFGDPNTGLGTTPANRPTSVNNLIPWVKE